MVRTIVFFHLAKAAFAGTTLSLLITLFATSEPVFAETLVSGSVYFDSEKTLEEVVQLSAEKDNESILKLIKNGHVSQKTDTDQTIVILTTGLTPESPAEFRFLTGPTTYWTLAKFVAKSAEPTPTPTPEISLTAQRKHRELESGTPPDDDNGRRTWHKVDGQWRWYPTHKTPAPVKKSIPNG